MTLLLFIYRFKTRSYFNGVSTAMSIAVVSVDKIRCARNSEQVTIATISALRVIRISAIRLLVVQR